MTTELWNGTTLADLPTMQFPASLAGSAIEALALSVGGFLLAGWARNRAIGLFRRTRMMINAS